MEGVAQPSLGQNIHSAVVKYMEELGCCDDCLAKARADLDEAPGGP